MQIPGWCCDHFLIDFCGHYDWQWPRLFNWKSRACISILTWMPPPMWTYLGGQHQFAWMRIKGSVGFFRHTTLYFAIITSNLCCYKFLSSLCAKIALDIEGILPPLYINYDTARAVPGSAQLPNTFSLHHQEQDIDILSKRPDFRGTVPIFCSKCIAVLLFLYSVPPL